MKKLKAFTMIELVVAMMISAIVISIAFYVWTLISAQLSRRQSRSAAITNYVLFQRAFTRDFENAQGIRDLADSISFQLDIGDHAVRYSIGTDRILRERDGLTDTFQMGGRVVQRTYVNDSLPLISGVRLNITINREDVSLALQKEYTIAELLRGGGQQPRTNE